jgi:hypothetical protein
MSYVYDNMLKYVYLLLVIIFKEHFLAESNKGSGKINDELNGMNLRKV